MYRTNTCGELRVSDVDKKVKLAGWVDTVRDLGAVIFFTVRDFYGITQVVASDEDTKAQVRDIGRESTILVDKNEFLIDVVLEQYKYKFLLYLVLCNIDNRYFL